MEQVLQRRALGAKQECTGRVGCKLVATRSVAAVAAVTDHSGLVQSERQVLCAVSRRLAVGCRGEMECASPDKACTVR